MQENKSGLSSKRAKLIADLFGDSRGFLAPAKIIKISKKLHFLNDDELIDFSIFSDRFRGNFISTELVIHKASIAWQRLRFESVKYIGCQFFKDIGSLILFCQQAYRGEALCSCEIESGFLPYVIITVDDEGNLRNSESVNENGVFSRLNGSETTQIYEWLFNNQHKIGDIKRISKEQYQRAELDKKQSIELKNEPKQLMTPKQQEQRTKILNKALANIKGIK